jgi:hypothetical protein
MVSSGAYAAPSLLFIAVSFRVEMLRRGAAWVMSGIVIGLGASVVITRLLTGLLFGVSVTNIAVFGSVAKNILTTFNSGNESNHATIPCVASEFLQQSLMFYQSSRIPN